MGKQSILVLTLLFFIFIGIVPASATVLESLHPTIGMNTTDWTLSFPESTQVRFHFTELVLSPDPGDGAGDTLNFYSGNNLLYGYQGGDSHGNNINDLPQGGWTQWFAVRNYTVRLTTVSGNSYGFLIDQADTRNTSVPLYNYPATVAESFHPTAAGFSYTWNISNPTVSAMQFHFANLDLARDPGAGTGDTLNFYDANGNLLYGYQGGDQNGAGSVLPPNGWTPSYPVNSYKITLNTKSGNTYGFLIDGTNPPLPTSPVAHFIASPYGGFAPLTVQFTDQSSGNPVYWDWDFGDSDKSSIQNPIHTYDTPGTYSVTLNVGNTGGFNKTPVPVTISVFLPPRPIADFNSTQTSGVSPLTVQFHDLSTGTPDILEWFWNFGDSQTSEDQNPVHVYGAPGNYNVSLVVKNGADSPENPIHTSLPKQQTITIIQSSIVHAAFSGNPQSGTTPLAVQFTDQSTGNPTSWAWTFGDGQSSTEQDPVHVYTTPGTYRVGLEVANPGYSDYLSKENYITAIVNPDLVADFIGSPTYGTLPLTVQFTDQSSGNPNSWIWDFGDGMSSTDQDPFHTYAVPGQFTVGLTVQNAEGTTAVLSKPDYIFVQNGTPGPINGSAVAFYTGWNYVSVPATLASGWDTFAIFSQVDMASHSIWLYDSVNQNWVKKYPGDQVLPLYGYWIYSNSQAVIPLHFSSDPLRVPPTRELSTGWNAIGFTGMIPASARDTLISVKSSWTQAEGFDSINQTYETQIINGGSGAFSDSRQLFPTKGYWLYMTSPGELSAIAG
jgi:PKD repeat protein